MMMIEWTNDLAERDHRDTYYRAISRMRQEYLKENEGVYDLTARPTLHFWAEEKYGFKMGLTDSGEYNSNYAVTDEKRFMIFKLKYWS